MGKGGGGAPPVQDPTQIANLATQSNIQTAIAQSILNNQNQNTPWGSISYTHNGGGVAPAGGTPSNTGFLGLGGTGGTTGTNSNMPSGVPQWTQNMTLNPQLQGILESGWQNQGNLSNIAGNAINGLGDTLGQPLTGPQLGTIGNGPQLNTQGGTAGPIQNSYGSGGPIQNTIANAGNIQTSLGDDDFSGARQRVEDALMGRLNTQIDKDRGAHEASLANRGIRLGSDAYSSAMQDFDRGVGEHRTSAILGAGQEQNRMQQLALNAGNFANSAQAQQYGQNANNAGFFNQAQAQGNAQNAQAAQFGNSAQQQAFAQALANAGFGNQAMQQMYDNQTGATSFNNATAQQGFGNDLTIRNQGINEAMSLMNGTQVSQPNFPGTNQTGVAGTDVAGIHQNAWNQQNQQYQQQQAQWNNIMGGMMGLGSSALMAFSDERLKTDIKPTGDKIAGVPVKSWTWKGTGQRDTGVIAQEVEGKHPELVDHSHPSGYRRVDYGGLFKLGAAANDAFQRRAA